MLASFTGAWRTQAYYRSGEGAEESLGAADPARHMTDYDASTHGVDDTALTRRAVQTPYGLDIPPDTVYDSTDTSGLTNTDPSGVPLDREARDHGLNDFDYGAGSQGNPQNPSDAYFHGDTTYPSPLHSRDNGSMWARKIRQPRSNSFDETFDLLRFTPNRGISQSDKQRFLGNQWAAARPENNPEFVQQRTRGDEKATNAPGVGWHGQPRAGFRVQWWDLRKIAMHYVKHDDRSLRVRGAKLATNTPAVAEGNQYQSPFDSNVRTRIGNTLTPMLRRQPSSWDESVVYDGSEQPADTSTSEYQSWGL